MHEIYRTWLRHALTIASRGDLLTTRDGRDEAVDSLLSRARAVARRLECLRPDVGAEDEKVLTGLTQFDFLSCLVTMANSNNAEYGYPNFARFNPARTQPAAQRLLQEPTMRSAIYPGDDLQLAAALAAVDRGAQQIGFDYDGWAGYSQDVNAFIHAHGAETAQP